MPSASVTLNEAVAAARPGTSPIRFPMRMKTAKAPTIVR
jgi:hypothetical protein